jgi:hypothetical protein
VTPELQTKRSTWRPAFHISDLRLFTAERSETSHTMSRTLTLGDASRIFAAPSARRVLLVEQTTMFVPSAASWMASARPIPVPPPVMRAVFPIRSFIIKSL